MTERIVDRAALPSTSPRAPLAKGEHGVLAKGRLPADSLLSFRPKRSFLPSTRAKPWLLRERGAATKRSCKARLRGLIRAQFAATSAWRNLGASATDKRRKKTRPYILCKGALPLFHFTSAKKIALFARLRGECRGVLTRPCNMVADSAYPFSAPGRTFSRRSSLSAGAAFEQIFCHEVYSFYYYKLFLLKMQPNGRKKLITSWRTV